MRKITFVLDNIRSAFNVGSIFRTADGLDFDIHLIGITPLPGKDKKLEKTSLSALEFIEWKHFNSAEEWFKYVTLAKPKNSLNKIISIEETKKYKTIFLFDLYKSHFEKEENVYLVLGHEINGVDDFLLSKSDLVVKIPMYGQKNSLNVATCAGIVGYFVRNILK